MNAQQIVVGIFKLLRASGARNVVERTRNAARAAGAEFSNADVTQWLKAYTKTSPSDGRKTDAVRTTLGREIKHVSDEDRTRPGLFSDSRVVKEPLSKTSSLSPIGEIKPAPKPASKEPKPLPDWVLTVQRAAWATSKLRLSDLTAEQRFTVAQFHAFKFCNCASDQKKNAARAIKLAASLAELGESRDYGHFTVKEYVEGCGVVMQMTRQLVQSPWDFRASLEYGAAV